jgi:plasmid stabilization system protein ParE
VRRIVIASSAKDDIDRLEAWFSERDAPYARSLGVALREAIRSLRDFPERGRSAGVGDMREFVVPFRTWTYVISYRVRPDRVTIARIHHALEDR